MEVRARSFVGALIRRKKVKTDAEASQLNRCLSTFDLTLLGVGGTLGLGVYVLAGQVASTKAGPAVVLSFLIAAVASVFSALCYAELGARVPRAGSAYIYSYVTVGEFVAFVMGWNLILEYVIGNASVARGYSGYLDSLLNHTIERHMLEWRPVEIPDEHHGKGGFFPYGIGGVLNGAATCFYAFVGFDYIATMSEEVKNPRSAIPIGIVLSLGIVFLAYFGVSIIQTLLWPYYDQNVSAPLPFVFQRIGWPVAKWTISVGALAGLSTSLLGGMFALPRVLYAMGSDGLIFRVLATVHARLKTPLIATALTGVFSGVMAMMFNVDELANMMSIGTLLAYSLVAVSVLTLRYDVAEESLPLGDLDKTGTKEHPPRARSVATMLFNLDGLSIPTEATAHIVKAFTFALGALFLGLTALLVIAEDKLLALERSAVGPFLLLAVASLFCIITIFRQPSSGTDNLTFAVPLVPFIPLLNIFINLYPMMRLPAATWARFGIWMAAGMLIYFGYGIWHSSQRKPSQPVVQEVAGESFSTSGDCEVPPAMPS